MALAVVHPWAQFFAGILIGCWVGAIIACAGLLLFVGRKVRQLESINLILRTKLKARSLARRMGTAGASPLLVMPRSGAIRNAEPPMPRIARVN